MILKVVNECTLNILECDEKDITKMSDHKKADILLEVIDKLIVDIGYDSIIKNMICFYGDFKYNRGPCERCGDVVRELVLEV